MNALTALFYAESIKLRRSLVLGMTVLFPLGLIGFRILYAIFSAEARGRLPWRFWMLITLGDWSFFLLPMATSLIFVLLMNLEHQNHQWKHLNALPVKRWQILAAKHLTAGALLLLAHLILLLGVFVGGWVLKLAQPAVEWEEPSLLPACKVVCVILLASWAMAGVHSWLAYRCTHLGINIGVAIVGIFLTLATSQNPILARLLPWAMPITGLYDWENLNRPSPWVVAGISVGFGLALTALACWDANRREFP